MFPVFSDCVLYTVNPNLYVHTNVVPGWNPDEKKNRNYLMIDIGKGDQENFEEKNCGQSPQKIRNKSAKSGFTGWKCTYLKLFNYLMIDIGRGDIFKII